MSHRNVMQVIGRLVTDEEFRARFEQDAGAALGEIAGSGIELTCLEMQALASIDPRTAARFAAALDPRIQKISVPGGCK